MTMFKKFMDFVYSPLSGKYCDYFYYMAVIMFIVFVFVFAGAFKNLMNKSNTSSFRGLFMGLVGVLAISLPMFLAYFQSRLFYSMCSSSLR